jgi:hypothetical protein
MAHGPRVDLAATGDLPAHEARHVLAAGVAGSVFAAKSAVCWPREECGGGGGVFDPREDRFGVDDSA